MQTTFLASWREPGEATIREAWRQFSGGADMLTAMTEGLAVAELDPNLIAIGRGSVPNTDGDIELDASIMNGTSLESGAVCAVRGICPVIRVAKQVMDLTPCVMLAGEQARRFALENGAEPVVTHSEDSIRRHQLWAAAENKEAHYVHVMSDPTSQIHGDTVTILGLNGGQMAAASSTSGLPFKRPGRVGDSPILGAGIYADDEVGAAGATGNGEELWRAVASFRTLEHMRAGMSPTQACEATIKFMIRRRPVTLEQPCVVFALSPEGEIGAATTHSPFPLWSCRDGVFELTEIPPVA